MQGQGHNRRSRQGAGADEGQGPDDEARDREGAARHRARPHQLAACAEERPELGHPGETERTIDEVVAAYQLPTSPDPATVYTDKFLPPVSERMPPKGK